MIEKLFVDKTIEINAPARRVWQALTDRVCTDEWTAEFSSGRPNFHIESDWQLGSPVLWKGHDGAVIIEGKVTKLVPNSFLRYSVSDVRSDPRTRERSLAGEEDGITFELSQKRGGQHDGQDGGSSEVTPNVTLLHIMQGDFSVMPEGRKYRDITADTWDRVLPIIKKLAESGTEAEDAAALRNEK